MASTSISPSRRPSILFYDVGCSVCRVLAGAVRRIARLFRSNLMLLDLSDELAQLELSDFYGEEIPWDFYLRVGDTLYRGRRAIGPILRATVLGSR